MKAIIVSDLHIGTRDFPAHDFKKFLENLPEGYELVLNGDITDEIDQGFDPLGEPVLDLIRQESFRRKVIWVRGNTDFSFELQDPREIVFKRIHTIGDRLLVTHGDIFDTIRPRMRIVFELLGSIFSTWQRMGGKQVRGVNLAKNLEVLYKFYRKRIMQNAVRYARQNGFNAVTCGHTHYAEDIVVDGIRYINTGAWTENPRYYLLVTEEEMSLRNADESMCPAG